MADAFGKELLEAHNKYRAAHDAPPLVWSRKAASKANDWAKELGKKKTLKHGNHDGMGQNLACTRSSGNVDMTGQQAVDMWYNEIKDYDFKKGDFQPNTGHFTQVVWKGTTEVGAAKVIKDGYCFVVANYCPPGNMMGDFDKNVTKTK